VGTAEVQENNLKLTNTSQRQLDSLPTENEPTKQVDVESK
jgi:hypothetical protein